MAPYARRSDGQERYHVLGLPWHSYLPLWLFTVFSLYGGLIQPEYM